ncbi:MAG: hypothetical protein RMX96_15115 [Nostoc sp. ChiSLP02]|nr:hypothetical protein [Nostoc sp. DedSLP05]MDZ8186170.1 hypothetical protein [Nostoc sp. ChiSLP02]
MANGIRAPLATLPYGNPLRGNGNAKGEQVGKPQGRSGLATQAFVRMVRGLIKNQSVETQAGGFCLCRRGF